MNTGHLDPSWGYGDSSEQPLPRQPSYPGHDDRIDLSELVRDTGKLHSLCLTSYNQHINNSSDLIETPHELKAALSALCSACEVDGMTDKEVAELWYGPMNFGEFFHLSKELFSSMNRALNIGTGILLEQADSLD
jgi:hypothetical protein